MMSQGAVNTGNSPLLAFVFLSDLEADFSLSEQIPGFVAVPGLALTALHITVPYPYNGMADFPIRSPETGRQRHVSWQGNEYIYL